MTTRLGEYGGARQPYGSFIGKEIESGVKPSDRITRLGLYGGPRQLYGSFAGKEIEAGEGGKSSDRITRLGCYGGPRQLYGLFDKEIEAVILDEKVYPYGGYESDLRKQLLREDEDIMMIIMAFMEIKH
jgi:hypothetical protein